VIYFQNEEGNRIRYGLRMFKNGYDDIYVGAAGLDIRSVEDNRLECQTPHALILLQAFEPEKEVEGNFND